MWEEVRNHNSTSSPLNFLFKETWVATMSYWRSSVRGSTTSFGQDSPRFLEITSLPNYRLKAPIEITIRPDNDGWLVEAKEMALYAFGDTYNTAINNIQKEIESLYIDLMESDNYSEMWLDIKSLLSKIIVSPA